MLPDRCLSFLGFLSCLSVCDVGVLWPNGWMDQDATWYRELGLGPGNIVRWEPSSLPKKNGIAAPAFRRMSIVAKRSIISATTELLFYYNIPTGSSHRGNNALTPRQRPQSADVAEQFDAVASWILASATAGINPRHPEIDGGVAEGVSWPHS